MLLTEKDFEQELRSEIKLEAAIKNKVLTMFVMQDSLNKVIHPEWYTQTMPDEDGETLWDFQRAIMVELGELMDHYGYKWWKKQAPNIEQCQLEVIDVAHFLLSDMLQKAYRDGKNLDKLVKDFTYTLTNITSTDIIKSPQSIRNNIDITIGLAANKEFGTKSLAILMALHDITADDLCNKYILKNTLNLFRARNGYKQGTYVKTWGGKEDNEVLMDVYLSLDSTSPTFAEDLYAKLDEEYRKHN